MGERRVNWAIVGVGDIVRKRAGAAIQQQAHSNVHACVEIDPEGRREQIEALEPQKVYTDLGEALEDEQIHAVYVATPVHLHAPQAIAALQAGKDVLLEKPMALGSDQAKQVVQAAQRSGRRLAVAYFRRHWPRFQLVRDMLDGEEFGQLVLVRVAVHSWYGLASDAPGSWRARRDHSGGGVLSDVGVHKFDLLNWWFGPPRRVLAQAETRTHDFDVEDSASMLMQLADGAHVTASFNWNSKTWTDEIHVVGTEAKVVFHPSDGDEVVITRGREVERRKLAPPENQHYPLIDDFARSIVEDRAPRFTGADGFQATRVLDAVLESSRRGAWVDVT